MSKHSRGVMLRNRASGKHYWRDEVSADGGARYLRKRVRRIERAAWRREYDLV